MAVVSRKSFAHGFDLTEAALKRMVEIIREQIGKLNSPTPIAVSFRIRLASTVTETSETLDELISRDNVGLSAVKELSVIARTPLADTPPTVSLTFREPEYWDDGPPIEYRINADSRDWALLTSSLLEDRIKQISYGKFLQKVLSPSTYLTLIIAVCLSVVISFYGFGEKRYESDFPEAKPVITKYSQRLADAKSAGLLKDPTDAIIFQQKLYEDPTFGNDKEAQSLKAWEARRDLWLKKGYYVPFPGRFLLGMVVPYIFFILIRAFLRYLYPLYMFDWGDQATLFTKRKTVRTTIYVVIGLGFIVSLAAGIVQRKLNL